MPTCPLCGANLPDERTCADYFHEMIALEFYEPSAGEVHHLTVFAYMMQHNGYSDIAFQGMIAMMTDILEGGVPVQEYRRRMKQTVDSGKRDWKITRTDPYENLVILPWTMFTHEAYGDLELSGYQERVTTWAKSVLATVKAHSK